MIDFRNVSKIYSDTGDVALHNASFYIPKGDFVFMTGATGSGKTTISRLILREFPVDKGEIYVNKTNIATIKKRELPYYRRNIGVVFQDYKLLNNKTIFENIALSMEITGCSKNKIQRMVPQILSLVGLENKADAKPFQLSGGEKQRTAMARAMANNPPVLIADEPTGNLDPDTSVEIMTLFERFNKLGTTVLIATHDKEIVNSMNKRVIELKGGNVIRDEEKGAY